MVAGISRVSAARLTALLAGLLATPLRAEEASQLRVDLGPSLMRSEAVEGRQIQGNSALILAAAQGRAFVLEATGGRASARPFRTARPVYKVFGLDSSGQRLLYRPLDGQAPSGDLLVEDLATGRAARVGTDYVIEAAWSPRDRSVVAYTFASDRGFGLALANLRSGRVSRIFDEEVLAEHIAFERDGSGVYYYRAVEKEQVGVDDSGLTVADHSVTVLTPSFHPLRGRARGASRSAEEVSPASLPAGFPVLENVLAMNEASEAIREEGSATAGGRRPSLRSVLEPVAHRAFRALSPSGRHEVRGGDLLSEGTLQIRDLASGRTRTVAEGRLVKVLEEGLLVRAATASGTTLEFVGFEGARASVAAAAPVSFGLPYATAYLGQGGQGYPSPGCSSYYTHKVGSSMAYAQDFSNAAGHILASAAGTVAYTRSDVTCNGCAGTRCADYRSSCTGAVANSGWGNVVILEHADGTWTKYTHMRPGSMRVARGQNVCAGLYLGLQGHTGCTAGTTCGDHLHFQRQSSSALSGPSVRVSFFDAPTNPLTCFRSYTSGLREQSTCGGATCIDNAVPATSWKGEYFGNRTLTGAPTLVRNDGASFLAFEWGTGGPGCSLPADGFSARFGRTMAFVAGTYRFTVKADDGVRVYIDNVLVLDKWLDQAATFTFERTLSAGNHALRVEHYENTGGAALGLSWQTVSSGVAQFLCDDGDACLALTSPYWNAATSCGTGPLGQGGDMRWTYVNGTVASSTARYTPSLGGAGTYEVAVFIPRCNGTSVQAQYRIVHGGTTDVRTVNQNALSDVWVSLGSFAFTGQGGEYVETTDATGEAASTKRKLAVDAVRWTRQ